MELRYKVKNMEAFKDGNVLNGRFLKPNEILVVTEDEKNKIEQSGGVLEIIETLIPNPRKVAVVEPEAVIVEETVEEPQPVKRKAGRPKKNG